MTEKHRQHTGHCPHQGGDRLGCQNYHLLYKVFDEPLLVRAEACYTTRPTRFGVFTLPLLASYMSCTNVTTHLLLASDILIFNFEMGRSDCLVSFL